VEVLDAESRRWLLSFVNKTSKTVAGKAANKSILPTSLPLLAKPAVQVQRTLSASRESAHEFTLTAPKVSHPKANGLTENSALNTAPLISSEEPSPLEGATGGILAGEAMAVPVTRGLPVGGQMQKARLITSVLPVYPPLAMKNHVTGDVTVDALIDATGKVTIVKVISGPSLLREAAMDALRLWTYEPAWLDGHAVSTHLTVTVKFHFK
jgi:protein TonB